jgi:hypothetical protein
MRSDNNAIARRFGQEYKETVVTYDTEALELDHGLESPYAENVLKAMDERDAGAPGQHAVRPGRSRTLGHLHQVDRDYALSRVLEGEPADRKAEPPSCMGFPLWQRKGSGLLKTLLLAFAVDGLGRDI